MASSWKIALAAALAALAMSVPAAAGASAPALTPPEVKINAFFNGATVNVEGTVPAGHQAAVILTCPPVEQSFRVKEKVGGILWMNRSTVAFENLPMVYLLKSSASGKGAVRVDEAIGLEHLRGEAKVEGDAQSPDQLFDEFVKIKQGEGLYALDYDAVGLEPGPDGQQALRCELALPAKMPLGGFTVRLMDIAPDGTISEGGHTSLEVKETGLPALLSELAFDYGLLYGLLAVVIAICGGMITSMIFRGGGGGAH